MCRGSPGTELHLAAPPAPSKGLWRRGGRTSGPAARVTDRRCSACRRCPVASRRGGIGWTPSLCLLEGAMGDETHLHKDGGDRGSWWSRCNHQCDTHTHF